MSSNKKVLSTQAKIDLLTASMWVLLKRISNTEEAFFDSLTPIEKTACRWIMSEGMELNAATANAIQNPRRREEITFQETRKKIAALIKKHRLAQGMSQEEMADKVGVSQAQYSRYEKGAKIPKKHMVTIERIFDKHLSKEVTDNVIQKILFKNQVAATPELINQLKGALLNDK